MLKGEFKNRRKAVFEVASKRDSVARKGSTICLG